MDQTPITSTILVVDDNTENIALARATLEDEDYRVLTAENGEAALVLIEEHNPDCVLLDVRMPGLDGFTVCSKIRSMPGRSDIPVVFLTALRDVDTFDRALRVGGDDFLTKPVRPTELLVRVQAAVKLRKMSAEIREQVDLIRHQRDDLLRLQLQKERLTAFVIHDLKNPVNAMDLHAQLLLRNPSIAANARESVMHIRDEARSLLRLIYNLLDISKSEEGQLTPKRETVNLDELTKELLDGFEVKARAGRLTLSRSIHVQVMHADHDLLRRVLENLLDNAIRHAPPDSTVEVQAQSVEPFTELRVIDHGVGLAPEMRERVFDRFVQVEGTAKVITRMGRGLGLAFCKLAVEAHHGTITTESLDPGVAFIVRIPNE